MSPATIADFYERDIRRLIEEVQLFTTDTDLWRTAGTVSNPAGNLVLHITGGFNYLIGTLLAKSGYVRNREQEFSQVEVDRHVLVGGLETLIPMIRTTIGSFTQADMDADFPIMFDDATRPTGYVLLQLLLHLNYHLGQVNYLRRVFA